MYEELIAELRLFETVCKHSNKEDLQNLAKRAADAIEELQQYTDLHKDLTEKIQKVATELKQRLQKSEEDNVNLTGWLAEEHAKHLWIPVTERLPLLNTPVLATDGIEVDILWMYGVPPRWITSYMAIDEDKITHWMPLPQTPKEES